MALHLFSTSQLDAFLASSIPRPDPLEWRCQNTCFDTRVCTWPTLVAHTRAILVLGGHHWNHLPFPIDRSPRRSQRLHEDIESTFVSSSVAVVAGGALLFHTNVRARQPSCACDELPRRLDAGREHEAEHRQGNLAIKLWIETRQSLPKSTSDVDRRTSADEDGTKIRQSQCLEEQVHWREVRAGENTIRGSIGCRGCTG